MPRARSARRRTRRDDPVRGRALLLTVTVHTRASSADPATITPDPAGFALRADCTDVACRRAEATACAVTGPADGWLSLAEACIDGLRAPVADCSKWAYLTRTAGETASGIRVASRASVRIRAATPLAVVRSAVLYRQLTSTVLASRRRDTTYDAPVAAKPAGGVGLRCDADVGAVVLVAHATPIRAVAGATLCVERHAAIRGVRSRRSGRIGSRVGLPPGATTAISCGELAIGGTTIARRYFSTTAGDEKKKESGAIPRRASHHDPCVAPPVRSVN